MLSMGVGSGEPPIAVWTPGEMSTPGVVLWPVRTGWSAAVGDLKQLVGQRGANFRSVEGTRLAVGPEEGRGTYRCRQVLERLGLVVVDHGVDELLLFLERRGVYLDRSTQRFEQVGSGCC